MAACGEGRMTLSEGAGMECLVSQEISDAEWDRWLEMHPGGAIQQCSLWARSKQPGGWQPLRLLFRCHQQICGGAQLLVRHTRFGRVAYVTKGPCFRDVEGGLEDFCLRQITAVMNQHRIAAVVVQPPDAGNISPECFRRHGYVRNSILPLITATCLIDLRGTWESVSARISASVSRKIRRAEKKGVRVFEGARQDLPVFFELMAESCRRQGARPSPGTVRELEDVWDALQPDRRLRLTFGTVEGTPVAGKLLLCFGDRVTSWKKGWSGRHADKHPNHFAVWEAMQWAHKLGYQTFDFVGMGRSTAEAMLKGVPLTDEQVQGRDVFFFGFGGQPVLLPDAWLRFRFPLAALGWRVLSFHPWLRALGRRLAKGL